MRSSAQEQLLGTTMMPGCASSLAARLLIGLLAAMLMASTAVSQTSSVREQPAPAQAESTASIAPARTAWLKSRCSQLVAFFDRYGVGRGENSDGPRNHTRIGAVIECERANYRQGIDTMAALLARKAFDVPEPSTPAVEPQDIEAPDITNPTRQQ
jgi:hypothetical protein